MALSNEGREIAAFEEEALALRRELQEARASKTLAENHVAKCVNARSVTPVAFETAYVTSTPVRTALSDTCSLIPASSPPPSAPQSFTSALRPRAAELAHHFTAEKSSLYRTADCSTASPADSWSTDDNRGPVSSTQPALVATSDLEREDATLEETSSLTSSDNPFERESNKEDREDETVDAGYARDVEQMVAKAEQTGGEEERVSGLGEDKVDSTQSSAAVENETISSSVSERRAKGSRYEANKKEDDAQRGQKAGSRRSRKKKGNVVTKRSFSEADRSVSDGAHDATARKGQRTVSVDEDRLGDDGASRAITEIPEVAVVGGGSFVPKDLCSTGILTSRVLTAPSRATYTTAYI